jgi:bacillithiol system protein YtxJ
LEELKNIQQLDHALDESSERPVLLFKHSLTCPMSTRALRELQCYLDNADPRISYKLITVQTARPVSDEAAARLRRASVAAGDPGSQRMRTLERLHHEITAESLDLAIRNTN